MREVSDTRQDFEATTRPQFVELNTPFRRDRRWGGDNTDAYGFAMTVRGTGMAVTPASRALVHRFASSANFKIVDVLGSTNEIDRFVFDFGMDHGALPATLNYRGYTKSSCTSINHVVCHGIPGDKTLKDGDIVNIDVTPIVDGWHGDTSRMYIVGTPSVMAQRLDAALEVVPDLAEHRTGARDLFAAVAALGQVPVQRIHADLHLGQTLRTVNGWKIVDFEGEPAKPLAERLTPDSPWRDVAGMLRSFDYAPHAVAASLGDEDENVLHQRRVRATEWASRNRDAFLDAYTGEGGLGDMDRVLLTAYVVDKAVYECVYEARNRPNWLSIPLAAVARLTSN